MFNLDSNEIKLQRISRVTAGKYFSFLQFILDIYQNKSGHK
jgi:hypothetical protein